VIFRQRDRKDTHEVFGVSNEVLPDSYVDRGDLDERIRRLLDRPTHIALRGVSKCGKSWLRQTVLPDAIVIQCRLGKGVTDLYREALGELGVRLEVSSTKDSSLTGKVEASADVGVKLIAKVTGRAAVERTSGGTTTYEPISEDINDLRLVAQLILASGRRLVIEDFHYLSIEERRTFAFDLKALWDFGVFVVIVGVWSEQNMLLYLNPDLTGRVQEIPVVWNRDDLRRIFEKGGEALNIDFSEVVVGRAIADCYENAGILQSLILGTLDHLGIDYTTDSTITVDDVDALEHAELTYADQLNPLYQEFAKRVARGIRVRQNATGIYAHAMAVVLSASDNDLIRGFPLDRIFDTAHAREARIQKGNLRTVLERIESLQVDEGGRGLVLAYNASSGDVTIVDRQLLLYRKYSTIKWPWEDLIAEAETQGELFDTA
jgi:hypothetical protein